MAVAGFLVIFGLGVAFAAFVPQPEGRLYAGAMLIAIGFLAAFLAPRHEKETHGQA